jgi:hypothetical protein
MLNFCLNNRKKKRWCCVAAVAGPKNKMPVTFFACTQTNCAFFSKAVRGRAKHAAEARLLCVLTSSVHQLGCGVCYARTTDF